MSIFNPGLISDLHIKDIVDREDIDTQLSMLDNEIVDICRSLDVDITNIPVDITGYCTSSKLNNYCLFWIYCKLLADFWGGASGSESDIYKAKLEYYSMRLNGAKTELTRENILGVNLSRMSYIQQAIIF